MLPASTLSEPRATVRVLRACTSSAAFVIPALCMLNYMLNHYYEHGSYLLDTGWFAWMASHANSWPLANPPTLGDTYFSTHISLIFYPLTGLHRLVALIWELDDALWFSLVQAGWAGLTSLAIYALLDDEAGGAGWQLARATLAILASMNGIALAIAAFPHIEAAIPALTLCFFALLLKQRKILAGVALILTLSIREDAGLHLFGLLLLTACVQWWRDRAGHRDPLPWRSYAVLALCCLLWSVVAIVWQKTHFRGDNALVRIYLGEPAFAHLTPEFFSRRWHQLWDASLHVLAPVALLLAGGLATRDGRLLAAPLSVLPWIGLSVLALTYGAGVLANYYAFPVMIAVLWPAVVYAMDAPKGARRRSYPVVWLTAAVLLSILCFGLARSHAQDAAPWRSFDFTWTKLRQPTETALDAFWRHHPDPAHSVLFDDSVSALRPGLVKHEAWLYADTLSPDRARAADTVIYMPRGAYPHRRADLDAHGYDSACRYDQTHLVVRSKQPLDLPGCLPYVLPANHE